MRPLDIQAVGNELAIKWEDGNETYLLLEFLRRACPCAECQGEKDIMGTLHKGPAKTLTAASFRLKGLERVGTYAVQPLWQDGHSTGLYSYEYLLQLAQKKNAT